MGRYLRDDGGFLPRTFGELKDCYTGSKKECVVFQTKYNREGHSTTMSNQWIHGHWYEHEDQDQHHSDRPGAFRKIPCFHAVRYEPYVVLEWCPSRSATAIAANEGGGSATVPAAPFYDERFYGYGKNKIELVSHLRWSGYGFEVLPEGFLIHNPHPESRTKERWNDRKRNDLHSSMDRLYAKFTGELEAMYDHGHGIATELCDP
mmetsp:Transcript_4298/g.10057  ORF Transcript_4298/g.10057 Transcript_4298/m.10057 type:complete len:205 (-) Transcript_4298:3200-3814(-)